MVRWDIGISPLRINFGDHAMSSRFRPLVGPLARKSASRAQSRRQCAIRVAKSCGHKGDAGAGEETAMFELKKFLNLSSVRAFGAAFAGFDKILNWKLLRGSHYFPGPDGGTCVNEAAIV
jgi:hypothetical protein